MKVNNFHKYQDQSLLECIYEGPRPYREMITEPNRKLRNNNLMYTKTLYDKDKLCSKIYTYIWLTYHQPRIFVDKMTFTINSVYDA